MVNAPPTIASAVKSLRRSACLSALSMLCTAGLAAPASAPAAVKAASAPAAKAAGGKTAGGKTAAQSAAKPGQQAKPAKQYQYTIEGGC